MVVKVAQWKAMSTSKKYTKVAQMELTTTQGVSPQSGAGGRASIPCWILCFDGWSLDDFTTG